MSETYDYFGAWQEKDKQPIPIAKKRPRLLTVRFVSDENRAKVTDEMESSMRSGWYLMPREWMKWDCFRPEPHTEREAYQWSVEQAAFKDHAMWFKGSRYELVRGEFVTSQHDMMDAFQWTEKRVRLFIRRMVELGYWAKRPAHGGQKAPTVITICKYNILQRPNQNAEGSTLTAKC